MAFADPQSVTINAIANSLARVPSAPNSGAFLKDDGLVGLNITQNMGKRNRRTIRLNHSKIAADPLLAGVNQGFYVGLSDRRCTPYGVHRG